MSEYCMEEFLGILDSSENMPELKKRIYSIVLESAHCIYDPLKLIEIEDYWKNQRNIILEKMKSANNPAISKKLIFIDRVIKILPDFAEVIGDFYNLPIELHLDGNFLELLWEINSQLDEEGYISFYEDIDEMDAILNPSKAG